MDKLTQFIFEHVSTLIAHAQTKVPDPYLTYPKLENPLGAAGITDLPSLIEMVLRFVVDLGTPLVAVAFIWTGLKYVLAQGNPQKLKDAHQTAKFTFIGAALILGAFVITKVITATIGEVIN